MAYVGLGIYILRNIFKTVQKGYKQAKVEQNQTVSGRKVILLDSICSLDINRCNQENIVYTSLGIHILKDIFKDIQKGYKWAKVK